MGASSGLLGKIPGLKQLAQIKQLGGIDLEQLMAALNQRGLQACLMHFRGCSDQPNRLPQWYHSGQSDDPQRIVEYLREQMSIEVYAAVGFSLGGNVLLKWLGEQGAAMPLQRAAVMSVPFRLEHAAQRMEEGFSRLYQRYLVGSMQRKYKQKFTRVLSPLDVDVDTLKNLGPLRGMAGIWQGTRGLDVKPGASDRKEEAYIEYIELQPIDPQVISNAVPDRTAIAIIAMQ